MEKQYSSEQNIQMLVALLKKYNIKKIVASPGTTNLSFVACLQHDPFFEIYSSVDERSAAYLACGMSMETSEAVVITCTGATASRNYLSGLTEAYYRKLPILAVTGTKSRDLVGNLVNQVIDRSVIQKDVAVYNVYIPTIKNREDVWATELNINKALSSLTRRGGGPVHIDLETVYDRDFTVTNLPEIKKIDRISYTDEFPVMPKGRIGVFIGSHKNFTQKEQDVLDAFCASYDAVVFCDHTSGYYGKYAMHFALPLYQSYDSDLKNLDLMINIGEVSGEYGCLGGFKKKQIWRVSEDGEMRDTFRQLNKIFEMHEEIFFAHYIIKSVEPKNSYFHACKKELANIMAMVPELPFSNPWIALTLAPKLPKSSVLHLGILNSLRSWNYFEIPETVKSYGNVGGFGIDGCVSTMIGASVVNLEKLFFCIIGDLGFFYDINVLGNRHIKSNIRIMLVNNGRGTEFRNYYHTGSTFGDAADPYICAAGHFGNQSPVLVKHFVEDLGFKYISAKNKDEFIRVYPEFVAEEIGDKPIVFEVFTDSQDESDAINILHHLKSDIKGNIIETIANIFGGKQAIRKMLGNTGVDLVKKIIK